MRRLLLLAALTATGSAAAQPTVWTEPATPPCDALRAFHDADIAGRMAYAGDVIEQDDENPGVSLVRLRLSGLAVGTDSVEVFAVYEEEDTPMVASLIAKPQGLIRPTQPDTWERDARTLASAIAGGVAACLDASGPQEPWVGERQLSQSIADSVELEVAVDEQPDGTLRLVPTLSVN
jgi:hypothetical protein